MDETLITPQLPQGGAVRRGRDVKGVIAQAKTTGEVASDADKAWDSAALTRLVEAEVPSPPDVGVVVKMMGSGFGEVVEGRMLEKIEIPAASVKET